MDKENKKTVLSISVLGILFLGALFMPKKGFGDLVVSVKSRDNITSPLRTKSKDTARGSYKNKSLGYCRTAAQGDTKVYAP